MIAPHKQEVFAATAWAKGNTGRTKKVDYNVYFKMYYRIVSTAKILDQKKGLVKKQPQTLIPCGGRDISMGHPQVSVDPDPCNVSVFSKLPSIQAAQKTTPRLNIACDCEYKQKDGHRIITSYQFAVYSPSDNTKIVEVIFENTMIDARKRLFLRTCLGAIFDLLIYLQMIDVINPAYASTRVYNTHDLIPFFEGSDDTYKVCHSFKNINDARSYKSDNKNALVVLDKSNPNYREVCQTNDFSAYKKKGIVFETAIVCHAGIVDLTAFQDDIFGFKRKKGNIMPYLKSMQGGLTSIYPFFLHVPSAKSYWKFYPINVVFRDTMCCAPADGKSLARLGDCVGVPKIILPDGAIANMDEYMMQHPDDYRAYAAQDALVTLMYGSRLWGINVDWPLTSTAGACFAMQNSIADYLNISRDNKNGKIDKDNFDRVYRGYQKVKKGKISTPVGLRPVSAVEPVSYEAGQLHDFSAAAYAGGFNTCSTPGVFIQHHTYDFDLENAYPTAMCLVYDIDFDNPIEREFTREPLSLQAFRTPVDPLFALVDFEFPKRVKYPCIAIHEDGSIIFPRKGEAVYASGPSLYLALKLGAKIYIRRGYMARIKTSDGVTPYMSLRAACKQMVQDRAIAKSTYGKGSIEEQLCKLFVNGSYGKIAQDVIEKSTWDGWNEYMTDIGYSAITSPERAALITDIVRCMLIGTMNQLADIGKITYSVTTDGFITDATYDDVNSVDCYGFRRIFEMARVWLTNNPTIWAVKHEQGTLINPTTRCNIGYDIPNGKKGVLAHGGVITAHAEYEYDASADGVKNYIANIPDSDDIGGHGYKDSDMDRHRMAELVLLRKGRILYVSREFPNVRDLGPSGTMKDFQTSCKAHQVRLDFDLKRKPIRDTIHDVVDVIDGISFVHATFDTMPFDSVDEYRAYRQVNKSFTCLRTKSDWDRYFLKLDDCKNGYKRHAPDEWSRLMSVIQGYRYGLWSIPDLDACQSDNGMNVDKALDVINAHNHSIRKFNKNAWKNARRPERASHMLPQEMIQDLLDEFGATPTPHQQS